VTRLEFRGPDVQRIKLFVQDVQEGKCILCPEFITQMHHIYPWRKFPTLLKNLRNIVGTCKPHHLLLESKLPEEQLSLIVSARCA
jgi:hypothetical protein